MTRAERTELVARAGTFYRELFEECADSMKKAGIPINYDRIVDFGIIPIRNTRAICRSYDEKNEFGIYIDRGAVYHMDDKRVVDNIRSVLCHELLHTCPGCMTHNEKFLEYARLCDEKLSTKTLRHIDKKLYYNPDLPVKMKLLCENCGFEHFLSYDFDEECECEICGKIMKRI